MDRALRLKDAMIVSVASAASAIVAFASIDSLAWRRVFGIIAVGAWIVAGTSSVWLALHLGHVTLPHIERFANPIRFWASVAASTVIWVIFLGAICLGVWSRWS
jgi:hypothetical protein